MKYIEISKYITDWLKDYVISNKLNGFVIGVSGGIDSSVASTLCAKTGLPLLVVEMPIHQNVDEVSLGKSHIEFLKNNYPNVRSIEVDLTSTFDTMKGVLNLGNGDKVNLSLANTRSRLRMTTLYSFATLDNFIVCGTGNKIEDYGINFFTKFGDGGCDLNPLGDLMKSDVYELGRVLGLGDDVLSAVPTDGLFDGSPTDEDQIGASYDELEWAMRFVEDNWYWETGMENSGELDYDFDTNKTKIYKTDLNLTDREKEVLKIYLDRHSKGSHKMKMPPICHIPDKLKN